MALTQAQGVARAGVRLLPINTTLHIRQRRATAALSQKAGLLALLGGKGARRAAVRAVSNDGKDVAIWTPDGETTTASEVQSSQSGHHSHTSGATQAPTATKKIVCEFILQALFNFLSMSAVAMAVQNSAGNAALQTVQVILAHAVILPLLIYTGKETSGAHFNPVVTASFVVAGKMSVQLGVGYILAQLAGGILGAAAAFSSLPRSMQDLAHAGLAAVPAESTIQQAFMGEAYASFLFLWVLLGLVDDKRGWGSLGPLAIPLVIGLLMWLVGPVSSMCINPARALGPAVITGFTENLWIFFTAPFVGGLAATLAYTTTCALKKA